MVTQKGSNVDVVAIHGNFDNAQSGVKAMFENKNLQKNLPARDISFHQPTLLISDAWFRRLFIMYMHMQNFWKMKNLRTEKNYKLSFRQVILEIFLQLTMQNRWVCRLVN